MVNYVLLLDKNQTTDQKVVSSNPAGCAIKKNPPYGSRRRRSQASSARVLNHSLHMEGFFNGLLDGREITAVSSG